MHCSDLNALLRGGPEAKRCFDTRPDYAREQIRTRSGSVNSFASLKRKPFPERDGFRFPIAVCQVILRGEDL